MTAANLLRAFERLRDSGAPLVLATVIETAGSTYRKSGARMLITRDGQFHGLLGGGCFEGDLLERARPVFDGGSSATVLYDMRAPDDALWGLGLGCNGAVSILLHRLDPDSAFRPMDFIAQCHRQRTRGVVASLCDRYSARIPAGTSFVLPDDATLDPEMPAELRETLAGPMREALRNGASTLIEHRSGNRTCRVFVAGIALPVHLLLLGAGPDAVPLTRLARDLGWDVSLCDHRPELAVAARFPDARQVLNLDPRALADGLPDDVYDAAVVMSHNVERDLEYLRSLAAMNLPFVGVLGPAARRDMLLERLGNTAGVLQAALHGPVGLDLGGDSPESIALSIIAEIHACTYRRDAGPLRARNLALHDD